jgi:hypothetical protein
MTFAFNPTESKNVLWFVVGYKSKVDVKRACGNYFKIFSEISNAHNSQNFLKETKNTTTTLTKGTTNMTASNEISPRAEELRRSDDDFMEEILDDKSTLMIQVSSTTSSIATADKQMAGRPPYHYVPLIMGEMGAPTNRRRDRKLSSKTRYHSRTCRLLPNKLCEFAFEDFTLEKFLHSHNDPHGAYFAKWRHQKFTGSDIWDMDRRTRDMVADGSSTRPLERSYCSLVFP